MFRETRPSCASQPCRILLVDDEPIFQEGLKLVLERQLGLIVVGQARTEAEALSLAERENYEVVLMDVHLPGTSGVAISRRLIGLRPDARVIMLSSDTDPLRIDEALMAGAAGYIFKKNLVSELRAAIESVCSGKRYLCPEANESLLAVYRRLREMPTQPTLASLSPREREVLRLIADGKSTKDIATALDVSVKSAETYRARLMRKLNLFTVAELTRFAVREGIASA